LFATTRVAVGGVALNGVLSGALPHPFVVFAAGVAWALTLWEFHRTAAAVVQGDVGVGGVVVRIGDVGVDDIAVVVAVVVAVGVVVDGDLRDADALGARRSVRGAVCALFAGDEAALTAAGDDE